LHQDYFIFVILSKTDFSSFFKSIYADAIMLNVNSNFIYIYIYVYMKYRAAVTINIINFIINITIIALIVIASTSKLI